MWNQKGINVLSLFNGIGGVFIALDRLGVKVNKRYASEIDKNAMKVNDYNYPDTINMGDITKITGHEFPKIDFMAFGSPCQGFSIAGEGLAFEDPRSKLLFDAVRIMKVLKEKNPHLLFLMENVRMLKKHQKVINDIFGLEGQFLNSNLVSAQNREREYWQNFNTRQDGMFGHIICDIPPPKDKGLLIKDILQPHEEVDEKYYLSEKQINRITKSEFGKDFRDGNNKSDTTIQRKGCWGNTDTYIKISKDGNPKANQLKADFLMAGGHSGGNHSDVDLIIENKKPHQQDKLNHSNGKSKTLVAGTHSNASHHTKTIIQTNPSKESGGKQPYQQNRIFSTEGKATKVSAQLSIGSDMVMIQTPRGDNNGGELKTDKPPTVTINSWEHNVHLKGNNLIRRFTPIEVCRLQNIPDYFFFDKNGKQLVADSAIYKAVGNGFTIDMVAHILSFLPNHLKICPTS